MVSLSTSRPYLVDVSPHAGVARLACAADPFSGARKKRKKLLASRMGKKQGCGEHCNTKSVYTKIVRDWKWGVLIRTDGMEGFVRSYLAESHKIRV